MTPKLSVVTGTLNRAAFIERLIPSVRHSAAGLALELIVVDGGSTDGTADYLIEQPDVTVIWQRERLGAVAAFNAGFAAASGEYVAALNDDCVVMRDTLAKACAHLDLHPRCGQVAIPFSDPKHAPAVDYVKAGTPPRRYLYANFGVTRRALGDQLGWWGDLYHYGGDTELSLKIWRAGYTVDVLPGGLIEHYRAQDETRQAQDRHGEFVKRWEAWDGEPQNIYAD